jgi:RimJ/RimL family protein N-acetyltransferase
MLSPTIETERLILRRYKETDIDAIYEIITDERLTNFISYPHLQKKKN